MPGGNESLRRLRAAIGDLASSDAAEALAQARADARERVREILADELVNSMLESVGTQLGPRRERRIAAGTREREEPAIEPDLPSSEASPAHLAWYVYGVMGADAASAPPPVTGIDPAHPLMALREGTVTAIASQVVMDDFGESQLREHLADMAWVERIARSHERVLDELIRVDTVIPMRMCTVYRSEDRVREMLRGESEALESALVELEGKREWGVKVFVDPAARSPGSDVDSESDGSEAEGEGGAGAAYMERRRRERAQAEQAGALIDEAVTSIHERLYAVSSDGLALPVQRPEVSGHIGEMVLNGVYLVADGDYDEFAEEVRALQEGIAAELGLELQLTGPWPAYNFVSGTIGAAW